jgi:NitT/TauT family transport system permease protein
VRKAAWFLLGLVVLAVVWELYKVVGPEKPGKVFGWYVLPGTADSGYPHTWDIGRRLFQPERPGSSRQAWRLVVSSAWFTFRVSMAGFLVGALVGVSLAVLMARFSIARRALLPYLVASQTVPLIALAPIVVSWSSSLHPFGWDLPRWVTVALMSAFLAFFPISVGTLRGLTSLPDVAEELLRSYAAGWRQTLFPVRFPAAVPSMAPAFRLAALAAVIGAIVAEISTGQAGGIGRLVFEWAGQVTSDPPKAFTAAFGAAALGLLVVGIVGAGEWALMRNRPREESA